MATRETGKGLVSIHFGMPGPHDPYPPVKTILFHNFNFDGDELKEEHKEEIKKRLVRQIIDKRQVVRISGHASKIGDAKYNRERSRRRAVAVRKFLMPPGVPERFVPLDELQARGVDDSRSRFNDDELDRAVSVQFLPDRPKPKPPKHKEPPPPPPPPLPAPIIRPPVPIPVIRDLTQLVVIREVYIGHTLITHDTGEAKPEREFEGWRRNVTLGITATISFPFELELLRVYDSRQFFMSVFEAATGQRHVYDARAYFYKYDPEAVPSFAAPFQLPNDRQLCETLYAGGRKVDKTP